MSTICDLHLYGAVCYPSGLLALCGISAVLVNDATKHVATFHHSVAANFVDRNWAALLNALVWPSAIVMLDVLLHHMAQVSFIQYQYPIQHLHSGAAYPAFRK